MKLYELYNTDAWVSTSTLNPNNRILITDKPELLAETIYKLIKENPDDYDLDESIKIDDKCDCLDMVQNGVIKYLHISEVELDEIIKD